MSKEILKLNIEKAQMETDRKKEDVKNGVMRQRYHFMPQTGWLNDPNGFISGENTISFFSTIPIVVSGTVCIGGMPSARICSIGSICRRHWHPVKCMTIIQKADVFPEVR